MPAPLELKVRKMEVAQDSISQNELDKILGFKMFFF